MSRINAAQSQLDQSNDRSGTLYPLVEYLRRVQLIMLCIVCFFASVRFGSELTDLSTSWLNTFNFIGQAGILTVTAVYAYRIVRQEPGSVFLPPAIYLVSSGLFYGFGPMSGYASSEETLRYFSQSPYWVGPEQILRANLLSSIGIFCVVSGMVSVLRRSPPQDAYFPRPSLPIGQVALIFLVVGFSAKYLIVIPARFGFTDILVPGAITNLVHLGDLGLAIAAFLAARGHSSWAIILWVLLPPHFLVTCLEFSKKSVMLAILLPALGAYFAHQKVRRLTLWVLFAALVFTFLQDINMLSRSAVLQASNSGAVSLENRIAIFSKAASSESVVSTVGEDVQTWWLRLNYSGAQIRAMEFYDQGATGTFTQSLWIYFVPRFIWPSKPTMSSPGADFHFRVTGSPTSTKVGATVYADGYWKYGWLGVVAFSIFVGVVLGLITRHIHPIVVRRDLIYLPVVFLGMTMAGLSPNKFLQNGVISAIPVYLAYVLLISALLSFLRRYSVRRDY